MDARTRKLIEALAQDVTDEGLVDFLTMATVVSDIEIDEHRWYLNMLRVVEIGSRLFQYSWQRTTGDGEMSDLTECDLDTVIEVVRHTEMKEVVTYVPLEAE